MEIARIVVYFLRCDGFSLHSSNNPKNAQDLNESIPLKGACDYALSVNLSNKIIFAPHTKDLHTRS